MLKVVILDWDGTLADSIGKIIKCKQFLADKYKLPQPSDDTIKGVLGTEFKDAMAVCFPTAAKEILGKLGEEFHFIMRQPEYQATLFPNAQKELIALKNRGLKLAIATSKSKKEFTSAIIYNQLSNMFDLICCGNEYPGKPDPAMLYYIMKKCSVTPDECIMIGDSVFDMLFAANAGVKAVGVTFGAHSITMLQAMKPVALMSEWIQLPGII
jgi:phosphoglycolate phosphatase